MSNSRECMRVNGEALWLHAVYKKFYYKSHKNLYQYVLQVTCKSVSVYYMSCKNPYQILHVTHTHYIWTCNEIKGSYDKIIITIVPSYTGWNSTHLLPLALLLMLRTSIKQYRWQQIRGIVLYYGDIFHKANHPESQSTYYRNFL